MELFSPPDSPVMEPAKLRQLRESGDLLISGIIGEIRTESTPLLSELGHTPHDFLISNAFQSGITTDLTEDFSGDFSEGGRMPPHTLGLTAGYAPGAPGSAPQGQVGLSSHALRLNVGFSGSMDLAVGFPGLVSKTDIFGVLHKKHGRDSKDQDNLRIGLRFQDSLCSLAASFSHPLDLHRGVFPQMYRTQEPRFSSSRSRFEASALRTIYKKHLDDPYLSDDEAMTLARALQNEDTAAMTQLLEKKIRARQMLPMTEVRLGGSIFSTLPSVGRSKLVDGWTATAHLLYRSGMTPEPKDHESPSAPEGVYEPLDEDEIVLNVDIPHDSELAISEVLLETDHHKQLQATIHHTDKGGMSLVSTTVLPLRSLGKGGSSPGDGFSTLSVGGRLGDLERGGSSVGRFTLDTRGGAQAVLGLRDTLGISGLSVDFGVHAGPNHWASWTPQRTGDGIAADTHRTLLYRLPKRYPTPIPVDTSQPGLYNVLSQLRPEKLDFSLRLSLEC